jgi:hypothetical protein
MARVLVIAGLCAVLLGLAAAPASAYWIAGKPWPHRVVTYSSVGSRQTEATVDRAARIWNRARVGYRFVRRPAGRSDVLISGYGGHCNGQAYIGYPGARAASWLYVAPCPGRLMTLVVAHEFGHVLGLGHEWRWCSLMNQGVSPTGTPRLCQPHSLAYWIRHPLLRDDVNGARTLARMRRAR